MLDPIKRDSLKLRSCFRVCRVVDPVGTTLSLVGWAPIVPKLPCPFILLCRNLNEDNSVVHLLLLLQSFTLYVFKQVIQQLQSPITKITLLHVFACQLISLLSPYLTALADVKLLSRISLLREEKISFHSFLNLSRELFY